MHEKESFWLIMDSGDSPLGWRLKVRLFVLGILALAALALFEPMEKRKIGGT